jgi:hypothetical protein
MEAVWWDEEDSPSSLFASMIVVQPTSSPVLRMATERLLCWLFALRLDLRRLSAIVSLIYYSPKAFEIIVYLTS